MTPGLFRIQERAFQAGLHLRPEQMANVTHIAWTTGGAMVPDDIMSVCEQKGRRLLNR